MKMNLDYFDIMVNKRDEIKVGDILETKKGLKVTVIDFFLHRGRKVYKTNYGLFFEEEIKKG